MYTHGSSGMNDAGPTRQKANIISTFPVSDATFGFRNLSTDQPQMGAVIAYSPPLMTKTRPSTTGLSPNWRRCGSSTAVRKPIEALVAIIDKDVTITPGMLMIFFNEPERERDSRLVNSGEHEQCLVALLTGANGTEVLVMGWQDDYR